MNYRAYTSVLRTKQLLYYSIHSISTVEHHATFYWWATSLNTHRELLLIRNFVHTSGAHRHCVTSLGINLGQSFHIRVWAFRLTACVIHFTMLLHAVHNIWSSTSRGGMHEATQKSECSLPLKQLCQTVPPSFHSLRLSLAEAHKKWMKLG